MKIVIQRRSAPAQARLDWYVEKLCLGTLKTPQIASVTVQLDLLQNPAMPFEQSDNVCRIRVELVNGCYVATEAVDSEEIMAMYRAMDKMKSVLIERPSECIEVDRVGTQIDDSRLRERL